MEWLDQIPEKYRALTALAASFAVGAAATIVLMGFISLPERVTKLEHQMSLHTDSITAPTVERIATLERQMEAVPAIRAMVYELWCDRFPERCRATPRGDGR